MWFYFIILFGSFPAAQAEVWLGISMILYRILFLYSLPPYGEGTPPGLFLAGVGVHVYIPNTYRIQQKAF